MNWHLRYLHNGADFYDLFGPVERSRSGDAFIVSYNKTRIYDPPRQLDIFGSAAAFLGLERLPGAQNIESPPNVFSAEAGIKYKNMRSSLGAVDREKGIAWRAIAGADYALGDMLPEVERRRRLWRAAAAGEQLGVALRATRGQAWGNRDQPAVELLLRLVPQQLRR